MMRISDFRGSRMSTAELLASIPRAVEARRAALETAAQIVEDTRLRGAAALREQAERFDGVTGGELQVPSDHRVEALAALDDELRAAIEESIARVRRASAAQVPSRSETEIGAGAKIIQRWQPVTRAGVYIPGGKAVYPSSVIMNVVPAQVAGVRYIALASPPQADFGGRVHPTILAVAEMLGVTEVYAMGGAGAISALAYGVDEIGLDPVDVVSGPGNNFVASAKRAVAGVVGTDSEAGATEILIVADDTAQPRLVAADLLSQAEHDEQASAVLVTDSEKLAYEVSRELADLLARTRHRERATIALEGTQSAIILVDDLEAAAAVSNAYAPEHLELHIADASTRVEQFTSAGAIFIGAHTPVSLGDYLAGSNHVLPTGGQARYASGLGAYTFLRPQQVIEYDRDALREVSEHVVTFAEAEDLPAHGDAVAIRFAD